MAETLKMTRDDLTAHVRNTVEATLRETVSPLIADMVTDAVAAGPRSFATDPAAVIDGATRGTAKTEPPIGEVNFGTYVRCLHRAGGRYHDMPDVAERMGNPALKASVEKALAAGDAVDGGFLVPDDVSQDVIEILRPMSFMRDLVGGNVIPMPTGTFKLPKQTSGVNGTYIGENQNIGKEQPKFGQITMSFKKLAVVVPISNDLIRFATPQGDAMIRRDVARGLGTRENRAFLRDDGTGGTPRGLKNWVPASQKINANATVNLDNITTDLGSLMLQLVENDVPMTRPAWIFSPRTWNHLMSIRTTNGPYAFRDEMLTGNLLGMPFRMSTQVENTLSGGGNSDNSEVYLADFDDVAIGEAMGLRIDASDVAAYHDGSNVVAAYSQDQTVVRAIAEHDFAVRREESVALLQRVRWGA